MVAFNAWEWTARSLAAVQEHTPVSHEVVLVDNASSDETVAGVREHFPHVRLFLNERNIGFGPANNQAASYAHGDEILLLNTDAVVGPDWYEPLSRRLRQPGVGAVVPALLNVDGTLQGAGALVGSDGSIVSHGSGASPAEAPCAYPRVVDFGAAACQLLRRSDFLRVGGFDDIYAPAYFEDVDLCFKLADLGLATMYEPAVRVVHGGQASSGAARALELYERNRPVFVARWANRLASRPLSLDPLHERRLVAARDAPARVRVLLLAGQLGPPPQELVDVLADRSDLSVTLLCEQSGCRLDDWWTLGVEVVVREDIETVLDLRALHYDVVVCSKRHVALVSRFQPCAVQLDGTTLLPEALAGL